MIPPLLTLPGLFPYAHITSVEEAVAEIGPTALAIGIGVVLWFIMFAVGMCRSAASIHKEDEATKREQSLKLADDRNIRQIANELARFQNSGIQLLHDGKSLVNDTNFKRWASGVAAWVSDFRDYVQANCSASELIQLRTIAGGPKRGVDGAINEDHATLVNILVKYLDNLHLIAQNYRIAPGDEPPPAPTPRLPRPNPYYQPPQGG